MPVASIFHGSFTGKKNFVKHDGEAASDAANTREQLLQLEFRSNPRSNNPWRPTLAPLRLLQHARALWLSEGKSISGKRLTIPTYLSGREIQVEPEFDSDTFERLVRILDVVGSEPYGAEPNGKFVYAADANG